MSSRTVLIVDEDARARDSLTSLLSHEGYMAIAAGSSTEALAKVDGVTPGVALLDISVANTGNANLISGLHRLDPDWLCALLTPNADLDAALSALELGAYQYLHKPLETTELLNRVRTLIDVARLRSEKRFAKARLRESEGRLDAVLEGAGDMIFIKDEALRYTYINPMAAQYLGRSPSELKGRSDAELFGAVDTANLENTERRVLSGETVEEDVVSAHSDDEHSYHIRRCPLRDTGQRIRGVLTVIRDTTEKRMLEKKLIQAQKMEAMGVLSGGIAHDFNNILGAIVGHVDLALLGEKWGRPSHSHLLEIQKATRRASNLVKQILAFTRQDNQDIGPVKIAPILQECIQLIRAALPTTISIEQHLEDQMCVVMANPTHIHQIIMNLATNAGHAMAGNRGKISIRLRTVRGPFADGETTVDGPFVDISVEDNGCGMSKETLSKIFDPFFTTKQEGRGTGLGLAVVKDIVKRSGGTMLVTSQEGKGSEFKVILPRIDVSLDEISQVDAPLPTGTECILYVDDEGPLVEIGQNFFERLGYSVIGLTDPLEALRVFLNAPNEIDLVLTDQTMPDMTGVELARSVRKERHDMPIMICSGFIDMPEHEIARKLGSVTFLRKPVVLREFAETVRRVLDERKSE